MKKWNNHPLASAEFLRIHCKKRVLFLPIILFIIYAGMLLFAPTIENIPVRIFTYGFIAIVFLWLSFDYVKQAFMEIAASSGSVSVCWMGCFKQEWQYNQIDCIEKVYDRGNVQYCVYHRKKCLFSYTNNFQYAEEMYIFILRKIKNPSSL